MENIPKYAVRNDIIFKYLFSNKGILKDFLESLLNVSISKLDVKEQFNPKAKNFFEKICYLDIYATINDSKTLNLEMQNEKQSEYIQRIIIYRSALSRQQVEKGEMYDNLNSIISINILNYIMFEKIKEYHTIWRYREDNNFRHEPLTSDEIHFVELPKFRKSNPDFEKKYNQWLAYIDETNPIWVKDVMKKNKVIKSAENLRNDFISDRKNQILIDTYAIYCMDQNTKIKYAKAEGIALGKAEGIIQGKAEGIAEGKHIGIIEEKNNIVINMLNQNIDIDIISKVTNLSVEEINKIKNSIK